MMLTQTVKSTVVAFIGQNQCKKKTKEKKSNQYETNKKDLMNKQEFNKTEQIYHDIYRVLKPCYILVLKGIGTPYMYIILTVCCTIMVEIILKKISPLRKLYS